MPLQIIALALSRKTPTAIRSMVRNIHDTIEPKPEWSTDTALLTALDGAELAVGAHLLLIAAKEAELDQLRIDLEPKLDTLKTKADQVANAAESKTKDPGTLSGWGFPIRSAPAAIGQLPPPGDLRVSGGDMSGTLEPHWDPVKGAQSYVVEIAESADGPWTQKYVGTKSSCTISGLVSGKEYWVRVCAVGAAGMSDWSDRAAKRAS